VNDAEKVRAKSRRWYAAHAEEERVRDAAYREANRERLRARDRVRVLAWTNAKLETLAGRPRSLLCEYCGGDNGGRPMEFDHDHSCCEGAPVTTCGECFRGWICRSCNVLDVLARSVA